MPDPGDYDFALCLTHDVDRVKKTYQIPYFALKNRDLSHITSALSGERPYWQFEEIMELEDELGVRSAFYFLNEPSLFTEKRPSDLLRPECWVEHFGRYDIKSPEIVDAIRKLDADGWEVGLHGSFDSYENPDRLRYEKGVLEDILGHRVTGGRQHWLHLTVPDTWEHHKSMGLQYDTSLGSSSEYGFDHGHGIVRPFDDEFVVFPLTIMEVALEAHTASVEEAWAECERLLEEARENGAIMTILWHPRYFNEREFPGHRGLYRRIIERAQEMNAWVGPPGELYEMLDLGDADENADESIGRSGVQAFRKRITK